MSTDEASVTRFRSLKTKISQYFRRSSKPTIESPSPPLAAGVPPVPPIPVTYAASAPGSFQAAPAEPSPSVSVAEPSRVPMSRGVSRSATIAYSARSVRTTLSEPNPLPRSAHPSYQSFFHPTPLATPRFSSTVAESSPLMKTQQFAMYGFEPKDPSELALKVGDVVYIREVYVDGWCQAVHLSTGSIGVFPLTVIGHNIQALINTPVPSRPTTPSSPLLRDTSSFSRPASPQSQAGPSTHEFAVSRPSSLSSSQSQRKDVRTASLKDSVDKGNNPTTVLALPTLEEDRDSCPPPFVEASPTDNRTLESFPGAETDADQCSQLNSAPLSESPPRDNPTSSISKMEEALQDSAQTAVESLPQYDQVALESAGPNRVPTNALSIHQSGQQHPRSYSITQRHPSNGSRLSPSVARGRSVAGTEARNPFDIKASPMSVPVEGSGLPFVATSDFRGVGNYPIEIKVGEHVLVREIFSDGWVKCVHAESRRMGLVPLVFLQQVVAAQS
ncbi:uncharacterized protein BJ171DRAFT_27896 [Polychytrium aggregatum]|uniref:uncharacterized protein n=1 Tax=Polychytrium aggregatum TaxID=110093 RepID=UPI0022FDF0D3|nr:uncharacterized protein BJ171DRAFT_27896 [Polychytrium aggregatum]KAI9206287.1 hypothetical protein BJ171DRAFT_27896 [Polychytrium aggregatum]